MLVSCKICGKLFERVGNGVYCPGPHYRSCPVCGEAVEFHRLSDPIRCCSKECSNKYADITKQLKVKICEECGKEFHPRQATQKYCPGPHTSKCVICGNVFTYTVRPSEKPKTCSIECQTKLRESTNITKYGVKNVSEISDIKLKISQANSSDEVKLKRSQTCMQNWGVDNPSKHPEIQNKISESLSTAESISKREATCLARYGVTSAAKLSETTEKRKQTNLERYGSFAKPATRETLAKRMIDGSKVDNFIQFRDDPRSYISSNYIDKPGISDLKSDLGVTDTPIYEILVKHNCSDLLDTSYSSMEDQVYNFIHDLLPELQIQRCNRTVIKPYEIDLYIPEYKLGIECNPVYTHNSSFLSYTDGPKPISYHRSKSLLALENDIFLFHIFGYEWNNKQEIIKSMIMNLLHNNLYKYGARNTYVDIISYDECKKFLDLNHRQGNCSSSVRLGLRLKSTDELVSVMTFGHMRHTMGHKSEYDQNTWELSRFCSKLNTTVSGGASKLFKYFISNYEVSDVISFSDISHTRGDIYRNLGFDKCDEVPPSYTWVNMYDTVYYNRVSCQKSNLHNIFKGEDLDITNHTEFELMEAHKFARVYDSGKIKWIYSIKQN